MAKKGKLLTVDLVRYHCFARSTRRHDYVDASWYVAEM